VPRAVGAALLLLAALALAGCGTDGLTSAAADPSQGKAIFKQTCGGCHTLREAGTQGSNPVQNPSSGPNLDDAFAASRMEGYDESVIREAVRDQIEYPVPPMPEDLLGDSDADAVAVYVALVAANPKATVAEIGGGGGGGGGAGDAKSLFTTNCGSCHTLADAGTSGTVGPNLDQAKPSLEKAVQQITNGGGGMPPFGGQLTDAQIQALARYIVRVTGGG
jgi:mono/diheme cytochrome c family protein